MHRRDIATQHMISTRTSPVKAHALRTCLPATAQGKRHQQNLAKRAAREAAEKPALPQPNRRVAAKKTVKIGRPGYKVTKQYDPETMQRSLLFQVSVASDGEQSLTGLGTAFYAAFHTLSCYISGSIR